MVACVPTSAAAVGAVALLGVPLAALCLVSPWHSNTEVVAVRSSDDIQWLHYEIMSVIAQKCNLLLKMSISAVCIIYQCDPLCYCYANGHSYEGAADKSPCIALALSNANWRVKKMAQLCIYGNTASGRCSATWAFLLGDQVKASCIAECLTGT